MTRDINELTPAELKEILNHAEALHQSEFIHLSYDKCVDKAITDSGYDLDEFSDWCHDNIKPQQWDNEY